MITSQRFPVGTSYTPRVSKGKTSQTCTVVDFHTTRNIAGEIVKCSYVSTHIFCGQIVTEIDVLETTIARGTPFLAGHNFNILS